MAVALCPGLLLQVFAVLHVAVTLSTPDFWHALVGCVRQGLVGCLQPPEGILKDDIMLRSTFFRRMATCALLMFGCLVMLFGQLVSSYRRSCGEINIRVATGWTFLCLTAAVMMPCSAMWLGLAIGLWMMKLAISSGDDDAEDEKVSPSSPSLQLLSPQAQGEVVVTSSLTSIVVLTAAYAFLVPGIVTKMFSAKAVVGASVVLDIEKSTLGLISMLFGQGMWLPALIILVYSVLMPFAKLLVLAAHFWQQPWAPNVRLLQKISKWATVDVFTASTICGFFCQPHLYLEINLHDGFYYFLSYCVLSVAGALLMAPVEEVPSTRAESSSAVALCATVLSLSALLALLLLPIMKVQFPTVDLDAPVSLMGLVASLWARFPFAAISLAILLMLVPSLDTVLTALDAFGHAPMALKHYRRWIKDFAMLDVFALALVVVLTAVTALNNDMHLQLLPAGWVLCCLTVCWVAYSWAAPSAP